MYESLLQNKIEILRFTIDLQDRLFQLKLLNVFLIKTRLFLSVNINDTN